MKIWVLCQAGCLDSCTVSIQTNEDSRTQFGKQPPVISLLISEKRAAFSSVHKQVVRRKLRKFLPRVLGNKLVLNWK